MRVTVNQGKHKFCTVCSGSSSKPGDSVIICRDCGNKDRIRTFCVNCRIVKDMSLQEARDMFEKPITKTGYVFRFQKCELCSSGKIDQPEIFEVDSEPIASCAFS